MGWFDKLTSKPEPVAEPVAVPAPAVEPRDGIHHEYFVNDEVVDGRIHWHGRVYAKDGTPHANIGAAETAEQAASAAQSWAADKKRELRGHA